MTTSEVALVAYDVDADEELRDPHGRCLRVPVGEAGLLLGRITERAPFEGYTSEDATRRKVFRDVFEPGDAWFNSGDLLREVDVGYTANIPHYQFVDRVGDTFRWKSENVSTNEVGEIINAHPQVAYCNVYGVEVPNADGRAGMAALVLAEGVTQLDLDDLARHLARELPAYARPVFLRVQVEMDITGTFKLMKGDLKREAYHLDRVSDPLYVMLPGADRYVALDPAIEARIAAGTAGF